MFESWSNFLLESKISAVALKFPKQLGNHLLLVGGIVKDLLLNQQWIKK
jgi:hypothetical protein